MKKIALVRGKYLNQYELQIYYPLIKKYSFTGFGSRTCYHDSYPFPVKKLRSPIDLLSKTEELKIPSRYVLGVLNRMFTDSQKLFGLEENLKGYDIAHAADTHYGFTYQCIQAKQKGYVKKVVATIFENIPFNNENIRGRRENIKTVLENLDHAIAISQRAKEALLVEGYPEEKVNVITQGIDTKRFKPKNSKQTKNNEINILFVGRLEWYKGIHDVVYALSLLVKDKRVTKVTPKLQIVGSGSESENIKDLVKRLGLQRYVTFSNVSYDLVPGIYNQADICIAPSKPEKHWQEQFSTVLLEAQASGLPIISTLSGGISENVGDCALLVGPGDILEIKESLLKLILNPRYRKELGAKARQRAEKHFDIEVIASKIDRVYENILR